MSTSPSSRAGVARPPTAPHWLRQGLVVVQLAMALTLLAGAGFFVRGIQRLTHRDLGWDTTHEVVGFIELDHDTYGEQRDPRSLAFSERMQASLAALPGVEAAALSIDQPAGGFRSVAYRVEGRPVPEAGKEYYAGYSPVSPGFLRAMACTSAMGPRFPLRWTARVLPPWPLSTRQWRRSGGRGEDPIGKRIETGYEAGPAQGSANPSWAEVVGVVRDFEGAAEFYDQGGSKLKFMVPWAQNNHRFITFNVRTFARPRRTRNRFRKAIRLLGSRPGNQRVGHG